MASSYPSPPPPVLLFLINLPFMSFLNFTFIILKRVVWPRPPSDRVPVALESRPRSRHIPAPSLRWAIMTLGRGRQTQMARRQWTASEKKSQKTSHPVPPRVLPT